jgi:S-adenosylmethionine:tRNA ribosyltransferase-isomerase
MSDLNTRDYTYLLPEEKIAQFPLAQRDHSRLLFYNQGEINHTYFHALPGLLPGNSQLFFNDTKVIPARLRFTKDTGAQIEIFLLTPSEPADISQAMQAIECCSWKCTIGNLKRWKKDKLVKKIDTISLEARLIDADQGIVQFSWNGGFTFAEIIDNAGEIPLPPYLNRKPEANDRDRYQTIYSHHQGAVAAPTAGLHFTDDVMKSLAARNIPSEFLTLHVSAGTFQPIKTENASAHTMHREQIILRRETMLKLLTPGKFNVPVGTTSMRTLESIYWWGTKLLQHPNSAFVIDQDDPYKQKNGHPSAPEALSAVKDYMDRNSIATISGYSSIYIRPGYSFKMCDALVTNFHQPSSTLILLVAAFVGEDWRKIYQEALTGNYRFLSYGDSSLLIPKGIS